MSEWSKKTPTEPGFYWYRHGTIGPVVVDISFTQTLLNGKPVGERAVLVNDPFNENPLKKRRPLSAVGGIYSFIERWAQNDEWSGPITPPT